MDKKCPKCQKYAYFLSNSESVMTGIPNTYCAECTVKLISGLKITRKCLFCKAVRDISEFSIGYERLNKYFGIDDFHNIRKKWKCSAFCNECYEYKLYLRLMLKNYKEQGRI